MIDAGGGYVAGIETTVPGIYTTPTVGVSVPGWTQGLTDVSVGDRPPANGVVAVGVALPSLTLSQGIYIGVSTADGTNNYSMAIYTLLGALVAKSNPQHVPSTGVVFFPFTTTPVSLAAGIYFVAMSADSNSLIYTSGTAATSTRNPVFWCLRTTTGDVSAGGVSPNTITPPAFTPGTAGFASLSLY